MSNKIKKLSCYFFYNKKENNNQSLSKDINLTSTNLNLNSNNLNKNDIYVSTKIKQKANYFDSNKKKKQNKEIIKVKTISENLIKPLTLNKNSGKPKNFKSQAFPSLSTLREGRTRTISNTNLLNIYLKSFKLFKSTLVSYTKSNSLSSIFISENNSKYLELKKQTSLSFPLKAKDGVEKKDKLTPKILPMIQSNQEKNIIILKEEKDQVNLSNQTNNSVLSTLKEALRRVEKLHLEKKDNVLVNENFNPVNVRNKYKSSILLFINNFKRKNKKRLINLESKTSSVLLKGKENLNKDNKLLFIHSVLPILSLKEARLNSKGGKTENIRKYINSKTTFNSKGAKNLATSNNYNFNKYNKLTNLIKLNIYEFLYRSFISMFSIISKPVYAITSDKIVIQFFYLIFKNKKKSFYKKNTKSRLLFKNNNKLKIVCNILTRFFKKPVELDLIRLYYPYFNSNILVNLFGIFLNKIKLRRIVKKFI